VVVRRARADLLPVALAVRAVAVACRETAAPDPLELDELIALVVRQVVDVRAAEIFPVGQITARIVRVVRRRSVPGGLRPGGVAEREEPVRAGGVAEGEIVHQRALTPALESRNIAARVVVDIAFPVV